MRITEEQIEHLLNKWQEIIRLKDWDIKPVLVKQNWRKSGDIKNILEPVCQTGCSR